MKTIDQKRFERTCHVPVLRVESDSCHCRNSRRPCRRFVPSAGEILCFHGEVSRAVVVKPAPKAMSDVLKFALSRAGANVDQFVSPKKRVASRQVVVGDTALESPRLRPRRCGAKPFGIPVPVKENSRPLLQVYDRGSCLAHSHDGRAGRICFNASTRAFLSCSENVFTIRTPSY